MKPGATLGLSHGFLLGVMKNDGVDFRKDINVVLVAPKVREEAGFRGGAHSTGFRKQTVHYDETYCEVVFFSHGCVLHCTAAVYIAEHPLASHTIVYTLL